MSSYLISTEKRTAMACWKAVVALLLIVSVHTAHPQAQSPFSGLPFTRNFQPGDYKGGIQNWAIAQNRLGLIYIANNFGLLEFDGDQWQTYGVRNGTKVRSVAIDARGRIYVGGQGDFGFFFPDQQGRLVYTSLADSLAPEYRNFDEAWSVYLDNEKVYFCTFSNIYCYDQHTFQVIRPGGRAGMDHSFLLNRQLYVNQPDIGLGMLENKSIRMVKGGEFFRDKSVAAVLPLHDSHVLVTTFQHGIYRLADGIVTPWNTPLQAYLRESIVNCMIRLRNGNFAVGTQNNGLLVLDADGDLIMQLTTGRGIENPTVLSIYEDDLSNLWIGQNNGLAYVELGSPFTLINNQTGLPGSGYAAYLHDNALYAGTSTGVYQRGPEKGSGFRLVGGSRGQVYHLGEYGGELLVGHHNGAMRISGNRCTPLSGEPGSWVFLGMKEHPTTLIEGVYAGLQVYDRTNGHWAWRKKIPGFGESSRVMAEDPSGDLWVTHGYKGAYRITFSPSLDSIRRVAFYGADKGFPSNLLINVYNVRNELLFTSTRGVYRFDASADRFVPDDFFSSRLGDTDQLWFVREDALGNIYFVSRDHIGVFRKNSLGEYTLEENLFRKIRKYLNDDLVNIAILRNNEVLFGAKDGFIHYDPTMKPAKAPVFQTLIRQVSATTAHGDSVLFFGNHSVRDSISDQQQKAWWPELPYRSNALHFTYAATSYEGNANLVFQYYLENFEKDWSEWSTKTQKEYTNLKEGSYTFHVRARNVNGELSREALYTFVIRPPWYRSVWAYSIYGVSVLALLFTGFNILDRKYQREQQRMAREQEKELSARDNELVKLSRQSQEEINRLQHEKLESELRHMNNELGTATMHLLNKNEFITSIKSNLTSIIKKNPQDDVKKELVQITRDIEQNISADSDWEHFQFHFDRVHGDFTTRFKAAFPGLSPQEIKLSAYLRMNLSTKEIAQLLNISVRGVEISRYRLRKKLLLDRNQNLQDFILNF
ncbi:ligand-binding sensor domain-containing protein [Dawidia soli]|uniref:Two component regulator three y domain-containing protein n=1 Tax=Dawidia soli TaxID=2782352 RepID=A0AAP2GE36_9BACT|nr:triple tyrosine motif-containing protein [Dawidia soli]MBT1687964.1 two component regulator three y domain-containing protein [Dawidia soli]